MVDRCQKLVKDICFLYQIKERSMSQIAQDLKISNNKVRYWLEKSNIPRRNRSNAANLIYFHKFYKLPFKIKKKLNKDDELLLIAGIMLYWAEGTKRSGNCVDFVNSDRKMIKVFLKFLRNICGIQESRLRALLHLYKNQNELKLKKQWSEITNIPLKQFHASCVHQGKRGSYKKKSKYGTISIRYNDKKLFDQILSWIEKYSNNQFLPL